ncbi:chromosomal replication initiator protein DnaA [Frankineae bacterium MT45]|nr:chromosomal replication initiator protein DnaA [Frankineae bacterium MT45]
MEDESTNDLGEVWARAITRFDEGSVRPHHRAWLGLTYPIGLVEDTALLAAPNEFAKDYLENRLRPLIVTALSDELGREIRVAVTVQSREEIAEYTGSPLADVDRTFRGEVSDTFGDAFTDSPYVLGDPGNDGTDPDSLNDLLEPEPRFDEWTPRLATPSAVDRLDLPSLDRDAHLNPKYTFGTFVIGSSNRFTHAAAVAVAEAPAKAYNPLFIYGESGLGKTHLLHAIGHYAQRLFPGMKVRYVSSEEFTNDFINSLRDDKMQAFQARYRKVDVLLIDDIQFLERAERTQEEFFHTFNTLHNANKQIVISSDRPPRQLSTLEDRLRTRFEWGLITDVQAPDLETRIAILRKKAAQDGQNPPPDVLEYIATRIQSNIRELEGALIRVTAFASLNKQDVELQLAEIVLKDLVSESDTPEVTAAVIMAVIAEYFSVSLDDLTGSSRSRMLVQARQIAMYLCRELTALSLPKIGQTFGGRDHTTVMHADRKIRKLMAERMSVYNQITELTSRIKARARSRT